MGRVGRFFLSLPCYRYCRGRRMQSARGVVAAHWMMLRGPENSRHLLPCHWLSIVGARAGGGCGARGGGCLAEPAAHAAGPG